MTDKETIVRLLKNTDRFLVTTHLRPDGDAVGSLAGMCRTLIKRGAEVQYTLASPVPDTFAFLLDGLMAVEPDKLRMDTYDVILVLDSGDFPRTGLEENLRALALPVVNIDHHSTNPEFGTFNWVDSQASSTAEMVTMLILAAGLPLDDAVAQALYLGMFTDTRFFQNDSIRPNTFDMLSRLLATGLDPSSVIRVLTHNKSLIDIKTLGIGLAGAQCLMDGRITFTVVRHAALAAIGATTQHCWSAGLFSQLNAVRKAIATVCFVEDEDGRTYCEFRAKYGFDVRAVALEFGGGGHRAASGCSQLKPVDEMRDAVLEVLNGQMKAFLEEHPQPAE
ncbi:bifunctional oligoribonuclease/PAP phosphatase NrnA [bacterium]|nr:bifunctional oligoribonuclease/PAP phosphatase NrnA [candidate division CSSED10-310 bacterium]